ncbi:hypothetical protein SBV1_3300022 [Verrucomicrobia bacterium]|nr:hypothetical protein SBV1_3300022 [Verrucomicrobiota bacterium]
MSALRSLLRLASAGQAATALQRGASFSEARSCPFDRPEKRTKRTKRTTMTKRTRWWGVDTCSQEGRKHEVRMGGEGLTRYCSPTPVAHGPGESGKRLGSAGALPSRSAKCPDKAG